MNLAAIKNRIAAVERAATPEERLADALRAAREAAMRMPREELERYQQERIGWSRSQGLI